MTGALIILAVTIATGLILYLNHRISEARQQGDPFPAPEQPATDTAASEECCGLHAVCEKDLPLTDKPVYFDDEELDRFADRQPDSYTDDEVEEFRQVLYTLLPDDVYPWGVSLTRRNIALPLSLRDEWLMMVAD